VNLVGAVLGDAYQLTRLVGQGGMGAVYEGTQLRLGRRVAVKVMARELAANPEALARFRREAEVTSQLGHPHIVQVFDFGTAPGGEPYLVMEFLEGEDLEKRLARVGRLGPGAASHIVKQIASALAATHAKGIVHRDLKPANVFVLAVEGETDFVKVVDFGISKVRAATTRLTAALAVMGTPNYMAPEQAAGRVDEIDHRTDQWALGCIAYELCAGRPPFIGEDVASLLYQVIHEAPAPLGQTAPGSGPSSTRCCAARCRRGRATASRA
jgi:serine/threonine-protein kinase